MDRLLCFVSVSADAICCAFVQANVGRYVALSSVSTLELGSKTAVLRVVALCTAGPLADLSELSSVFRCA